jgi:hypothetical protein
MLHLLQDWIERVGVKSGRKQGGTIVVEYVV